MILGKGRNAMMILGNGVYNLTDAAKLTGLRRARVKQWFEGRTSDPVPRPVFKSDYESVNGDLAISFLDLVELNIGGQLREKGLTLRFIRRIHAELQKEWNTKHPFCRKQFRTDGRRLFACDLDDNERGTVVDVDSRQQLFDTIVLPFLAKIDYDSATSVARKWYIAPSIVVDPTICFGKPIVEATRISTNVLATSYYANGQDAEMVARWFNVKEEQVLAAVSFENKLAA